MKHSLEAEFQLVDHYVEDLSIKNSITALHDEDGRIIKAIDIYHVGVDLSKTHHIGELGLSLHFVCQKKGATKEKIAVKMKIIGQFMARVSDSMSADKFKQMLFGSGTAALYSVSRAIIATTTAQCLSSGQVRIPMINVLEFLASQMEEAEEMEKEEGNKS